jgi:release factor glutamine methyltransferase
MTTVQQAYEQLRQQLQTLYDQREANAVAAAVIAHITGFDNTGRLINKHKQLTQEQEDTYHTMTDELFQQKPLQYVLHEAHFYGMDLYVDESVLIPRPETEELVDWIIKEKNTRDKEQDSRDKVQEIRDKGQYSILDIGTGSGCIPIALKKHLPAAEVHAIDIYEEALAIAQKNAEAQGTSIQFHLLDILNESLWEQLNKFDIIVSNPPYITEREAEDMHNNILLHEPRNALFVPNEQPLLFYEVIAAFGLLHLNNNGLLFFEINEGYGKETGEMLRAKGYQNIELGQDMQGKDRMIKAELFS